jgi:hypothetical protein
LVKSTEAFAIERSFLTRLTVAAGPMHSHSGQEKVTAVLANQANSFEMLATSDRKGCAAGTAIAFVVDWQATRPLIDGVALLLGISPPADKFPDLNDCFELAGLLAENERVERAMRFGADQVLAQQRGLWQIIASRHAEILELG